MKALLAYYQGKFNSCSFEWLSATRCKVTLVDDVDGLTGSFTAEYDSNRVMVDVKADTGMKSIKTAAPPIPSPAEELPEGGQ
jgi:hypothetical protein